MPSDIRNICLIDTNPLLVNAFEQAGYTTLNLKASPEPFFDLPAALSAHNFIPDLVFQNEHLGKRSFVTGLETLDCPLLFWAIDPHLNAYWHSAYARLFDMTCSTQRGWIPKLKKRGTADVRWLPRFGQSMPWVDWDARQHGLAFVGRITDQRPARKWMVEFLAEKAAEYAPAIEQNLGFGAMMQLYGNSKIIPNESIFGEVNFRLFEGASCGCLVLSQDLGEEQEELFEPGREFDTYTHVAELDDKLCTYLKNDRLTHVMARAAYERVQRDHLPIHRVQRIIDYAKDATRNRATGADASKWAILTACTMWESGILSTPPIELLRKLSEAPQDADIAAATLRIQATSGSPQAVRDNLNTILGSDMYADSAELNRTGSMAALHIDHWDGAKAFWYRHLKATDAGDVTPPGTPKELLTLWARALKRADQVVRAGFPFDAAKDLPATAAECLLRIMETEPEDLPTLRLLDTFLRPVTGLEQARVGFLSVLTLHERTDWRLALEIALANLKSYRLKSGLEELHLARNVAREQEQEAAFDRALKGRDTSGLLLKLIK